VRTFSVQASRVGGGPNNLVGAFGILSLHIAETGIASLWRLVCAVRPWAPIETGLLSRSCRRNTWLTARAHTAPAWLAARANGLWSLFKERTERRDGGAWTSTNRAAPRVLTASTCDTTLLFFKKNGQACLRTCTGTTARDYRLGACCIGRALFEKIA
jgi:hypothetical protein